MRKARGAELPERFWTDPLMYQGASDGFVGPREPIEATSEDWGIDLEAEVAVITDRVPMGTSAVRAGEHIRLVLLVNDVTARALIPDELAKGFGFVHGKPASAFSPVAVIPDELGAVWRDHKIHLPLLSYVNEAPLGRPDAGVDMTFDFARLIAHAATTRHLAAGTIIGSGTVANDAAREQNSTLGSSCLAERRMLETLWHGAPRTPWLKFGDRVRIEMLDGEGRSIFGAIEQEVVRYRAARRLTGEPIMSKAFASTGDLGPKQISFSEIGPGCYAFTAQGDPNSGVIVGDGGVVVIDAQATPAMAGQVIERVRQVTDKPIRYVVLSHYHAVRVLGASAYRADEILASDATRALIVERGKEDWDSEYGRFPRLFQAAETIPGLTWPTMTFPSRLTLHLGSRRVELMHLGRGHTAGDIVAWVPDARVMFSGDLVEYRSACYCGDAHFADWPGTLDRLEAFAPEALVPGRGDALTSRAQVQEGVALTRDFLTTLYGSVAQSAARGLPLKAAFDACREVMDPQFRSFAIYEHCMPFNVARAYDEAQGLDHPRIWTAERDREMWAALQG